MNVRGPGMESQWFIRRGAQIEGPYTKSQLKLMAGSGRIGPATRIREGLHGDWKKAESVSGLAMAKRSSQGLSREAIIGLAAAGAIAFLGLVAVVAFVLLSR